MGERSVAEISERRHPVIKVDTLETNQKPAEVNLN